MDIIACQYIKHNYVSPKKISLFVTTKLFHVLGLIKSHSTSNSKKEIIYGLHFKNTTICRIFEEMLVSEKKLFQIKRDVGIVSHEL